MSVVGIWLVQGIFFVIDVWFDIKYEIVISSQIVYIFLFFGKFVQVLDSLGVVCCMVILVVECVLEWICINYVCQDFYFW